MSERVEAPPELVYALVADLPAMGRWSPECVRCDWVGDATRAEPGARFRGRNRRGWRRWSTKGEVVTAVPGHELAFDVSSIFGLPVARWSYRIAPDDGGSRLTETWEDRRGMTIRVLGTLVSGVGDRAAHNTEGMRITLRHIKQEAEERSKGGRPVD